MSNEKKIEPLTKHTENLQEESTTSRPPTLCELDFRTQFFEFRLVTLEKMLTLPCIVFCVVAIISICMSIFLLSTIGELSNNVKALESRLTLVENISLEKQEKQTLKEF